MTYQEFLSALRNTPREWYLTANKTIRMYPAPHSTCPALKVGGLSSEIFWKIATAADNRKQNLGLSEVTPEFDPAICADLISACGLTEAN